MHMESRFTNSSSLLSSNRLQLHVCLQAFIFYRDNWKEKNSSKNSSSCKHLGGCLTGYGSQCHTHAAQAHEAKYLRLHFLYNRHFIGAHAHNARPPHFNAVPRSEERRGGQECR